MRTQHFPSNTTVISLGWNHCKAALFAVKFQQMVPRLLQRIWDTRLPQQTHGFDPSILKWAQMVPFMWPICMNNELIMLRTIKAESIASEGVFTESLLKINRSRETPLTMARSQPQTSSQASHTNLHGIAVLLCAYLLIAATEVP